MGHAAELQRRNPRLHVALRLHPHQGAGHLQPNITSPHSEPHRTRRTQSQELEAIACLFSAASAFSAVHLCLTSELPWTDQPRQLIIFRRISMYFGTADFGSSAA